MQRCDMEILPRLQQTLTTSYALNPDYYRTYPGSWITKAVYQFEYVELGQLLSEMLPVLEAETFHIAVDYDGHNAFEEFVCDLLAQIFEKNGVIIMEDCKGSINLKPLQALIT